VKAPLVLETDAGQKVQITLWSLAGAQWPEDAGPVPDSAVLSIPFHGVDIRFPVALAHSDADGSISWQGLSGRQRETLAIFYRGLLSGKMATTQDVITSLDTPLDLVPMEQTEAEHASSAKGPKLLRVVINVITWLLLATAVVYVIGHNIFTTIDRIDIQHGRVVTQLQALPSERSGLVTQINVSAGQRVAAGTVLARLHDPQLQARVDKAQTDLDQVQGLLVQTNDALDQLENAPKDMRARLRLAAQIHSEFFGASGFDDMRAQWLGFRQSDRAGARALEPIVLLRDKLQAQARLREADVANAQIILKAAQQALADNHLRAASDGVVQLADLQPGAPFAPSLIMVETAMPRQTQGWISERFAETVYIGMPASIGYNAGGERITLRGQVSDVQAGPHPERPGEFGILVSVAPIDPVPQGKPLRAGAPVNLEAKREIARRLTQWWEARFVGTRE
jgi:multidrug resistance efflux pump